MHILTNSHHYIKIYAMKTIGEKIRLIRESKGLSQEAVAFTLGISQSTYARLEKKDDRINVIRLVQIAQILNCNIYELLTEVTEAVK